MAGYKKYILLASGESTNGAPVPIGTEVFLVNKEYAEKKFSSDYRKQLDDLKKWAAVKGCNLFYYPPNGSQGGYFLRARSEILQELPSNSRILS